MGFIVKLWSPQNAIGCIGGPQECRAYVRKFNPGFPLKTHRANFVISCNMRVGSVSAFPSTAMGSKNRAGRMQRRVSSAENGRERERELFVLQVSSFFSAAFASFRFHRWYRCWNPNSLSLASFSRSFHVKGINERELSLIILRISLRASMLTDEFPNAIRVFELSVWRFCGFPDKNRKS